MYSFDSVVRYSEVDSEKTLTVGSVINYFQDCSVFQSESLNVGIEFLENKKRAWLLNSWQITFEKDIKFLDKIKICTIPYEINGFMGLRNFYILNEAGEMAVKANSQWVYIDTESGKPTKVDSEASDAYEIEKKIDMDYVGRKIKVSGEQNEEDSFGVKKHHIDTNGHVNNGQYVKFACEYIPDDFKVKQLRVEYKNQARYGNIIYPVVYYSEETIRVSLNDENKKAYAVVEFKK